MSGEKPEDDLPCDPEAIEMETAGLDDPTDEAEKPFGVTLGDRGEARCTPEKALFIHNGVSARIDIVSEAQSIRADTVTEDAVSARLIAGAKLDQVKSGEFNLTHVKSGRLPSSSVILELPIAQLPPRAVQTSTRRGVYLALAGLAALSAASIAGAIGFAKFLEILTESARHHQMDSDSETSDNSDELLADADPSLVLDTLCEASPIEAATLYGKVEAVARSQEAVSTYTANQEIRLEAASTHQLMKEHFSNAHTWQDLDGRWQENGRAYDLAVRNLSAWGYDEALDRLPSDVHSIGGMLKAISEDDHFKRPDLVARNIAIEIAMMDSPLIADDPAQVQADLAAISQEKIEKIVESLVTTPPPVPPSYTSPSTLNAHVSSSIYDAPEPPMHLKNAVNISAKMAEIVQAPTPVLVEFEMEQIGAELPEPFYVDHEADLEEIALDEDEEEVGFAVSSPAQMGMSDAFDVPEPQAILAAKAEVAPQTFTEKATSVVKGWAGKLSKWFS